MKVPNWTAPDSLLMKNHNHLLLHALATCLLPTAVVIAGDPRLDSWLTGSSGRYARIYTSAANQSTGNAVTTWSNGSQTQALPAYSGVQEIHASADWIYLRTTGLGVHVMGPWPANFPNLPANQHAFYRLPRHPVSAAVKTLTGLGAIGYFVDGVAMFDSRDGFVWTGAAESGGGTGYWNREAYVNEGATFDPAFAHQENSGTYHYHANPVALRHLLGDHVDYNPTTGKYTESTSVPVKHSPILGWVRDGFPIYGPYGFASATNAHSGIRRMLSGFQLRNGLRGTEDLTLSGRTTLPAWAVRLYGVSANQPGPAVGSGYPLGRYMEDNAYLGDLGGIQGTDFDLDEYNGRFCVTPEFPEGIYAYFVSMAADGTPVFPYNIGRAYQGTPTGAAVTALGEAVTTHFVGGADSPLVLNPPTGGDGEVTLVWSAVEGGTYQVQTSSNLVTWTTNATPVTAIGNRGTQASASITPLSFYRITRTGLADHDSVTNSATTGGNPGGGPLLASVTPSSGARGSVVNVTLRLGGMAPPANVLPTSATLGTLSGTNISRNGTTVTAEFVIPSTAVPGVVSVSLVFPGPAGMGPVTFSLANGFSIL